MTLPRLGGAALLLTALWLPGLARRQLQPPPGTAGRDVLQELSGSLAKSYQGHDAFEVVEACLVRRFPIDNPGRQPTPVPAQEFGFSSLAAA